VARQYARGVGIETAHQSERRDAGLRAHAGWLTALDADPRLQTYRSSALSTIERHCRADVMSGVAADRADRVLREGDPLGQTARYVAAVGNDHYRSAFWKILKDPFQGHLRFGPEEVEGRMVDDGYRHDVRQPANRRWRLSYRLQDRRPARHERRIDPAHVRQ
jgi:hypothetical protein